MAPKPITLTFAGDSSSLERTFENVGSGAKQMADKLDSAEGKAKSLDGAMGTVGSTVDSSESKFMGAADVLDGLATTMGLNIDAQINLARGFGDIAGGLTNLAPLLSTVATKIGLTSAATWVWNTAQTALNAVMALNPIALVVIAIGLLVAAFVVAYTKSETFRDVVDGVFRAVKSIVGDAIGFILDYVGLWLGGLESILNVATKIPGIGDKFKGVRDAVREARDGVQGMADKMHGLGDSAVYATSKLDQTQLAALRLRAAGNVSVIVSGSAAPSLRAAGGPVSPGRPYIVGERQPELFVPDRAGTIVPTVGTSSVTNVTVYALDAPTAATAVVRALDEYESRNGARYARA